MYTVEKSLDPKTLEEWMDFSADDDNCSWKKMKSFLDNKSNKLTTASSLSYGGKKASHTTSVESKPAKRTFAAFSPSQSQPRCVVNMS